MLLIYEHTTFVSQNDVQNHHKNIGPLLRSKKWEGEGGGGGGASPGFATEFHKDVLMNNFPFLISTHRGDCRIFFYPLMCFSHYPRQYMNIVVCTYFYIISVTNSIISHMQSVRCLRNGTRAIFLYRKIRKIQPPSPFPSPPPPPPKKYQLPKTNSH